MLRGQLTILRAIERDDLDALWRWANDAEVMYYWAEPYHTVSRDELGGRHSAGALNDWLLIATHAGEPIGRVGVVALDRRNRHAEIAIQIGERDYWGQGYGSDALLVFLDSLFHGANLHKVWLRTEAFNERARRAYARCGFQHDGIFREHTFLGGRYHDAIIMSITEDEFRARRPFTTSSAPTEPSTS